MADISTTKRILVVDDDRGIVRLVRTYLEQEGFTVLTAFDGTGAIQTIRSEKPDLVVLDLMLPGHDGWEITRIVRSDPSCGNLPIIMLTARVEDTDKIVGLELGADDYVTKPFNPREVVARVKSVLRRAQGGDLPKEVQVLQLRELMLDLGRHEAMLAGEQIDLTQIEFKLLEHMMKNPGYAFTRSELIEKSLGYDYEGMERTLDSHIKNLRKKIETDAKNPTYIQTVYGVGYRFG